MKIKTYYYDGYDHQPIWLEEAINGLKKYYNSFDITMENLSFKNSELIKNFINYTGKNWYTMMGSRLLYVTEFLNTDQDMMICTDLDYVVLRADINVRDYLHADIIVPHSCFYSTSNSAPGDHADCKTKFYDTLNPGVYETFINGKPLVHLSCDYFALSRKACENIFEFYKSYGWDLSCPIKFADKYKQTCERLKLPGIVDESFYGAYLNHIHQYKSELTKIIEYKDGASPICSTTWGNYTIDLATLCNEKRIFHHFGGITKKDPEHFFTLLKLFRKS